MRRRSPWFVGSGALLALLPIAPLLWLTIDPGARGSDLWFQGGGSGLVVVLVVLASSAATRAGAAMRASIPWALASAGSVALIALWTRRANAAIDDAGYNTDAVGVGDPAFERSFQVNPGGYLSSAWESVFSWSEAARSLFIVAVLILCGLMAWEARRTDDKRARAGLLAVLLLIVVAVVATVELSLPIGLVSCAWLLWAVLRTALGGPADHLRGDIGTVVPVPPD